MQEFNEVFWPGFSVVMAVFTICYIVGTWKR